MKQEIDRAMTAYRENGNQPVTMTNGMYQAVIRRSYDAEIEQSQMKGE